MDSKSNMKNMSNLSVINIAGQKKEYYFDEEQTEHIKKISPFLGFMIEANNACDNVDDRATIDIGGCFIEIFDDAIHERVSSLCNKMGESVYLMLRMRLGGLLSLNESTALKTLNVMIYEQNYDNEYCMNILKSLYEPKLLFDFKYDENDFEIFKNFCIIKNLEITQFGDEDVLKNLGYDSYIDLFCKSFCVCTYKTFLHKVFKNHNLFIDLYHDNKKVRDMIKSNPYIYDNLKYFIMGIECIEEVIKLYTNNVISDEICFKIAKELVLTNQGRIIELQTICEKILGTDPQLIGIIEEIVNNNACKELKHESTKNWVNQKIDLQKLKQLLNNIMKKNNMKN
jgi:hypothetical protein